MEAIIDHEEPLPIGTPVAELTIETLSPSLQEAVKRAGWTKLMPVQAKSMPYMLAERDLMVQSRTGSGKTGAFVMPILERIDISRPTTQALILTPTRELANQIVHESEMLSAGTGMRTVAVYGGVPYQRQRAAFRKGAHLVVGTPGRVLDHLLNQHLILDDIQLFVMDEADRMLSVGFYPDMKAVKRYLPTDRHVNTCMFSATFPPHVMRLANEFLIDPAVLSLSSDHVHVTNTEHVMYEASSMEKDRLLVRLLEMENPNSAIIFCNSKVKVNYVTVVLQRFGYDADQLSGNLAQKARERVLKRIRAGNLRYLVATDVAARGIDISELSHVFQYDVPQNPEAYIHRAGRTGRAGASGTAIVLVDLLEKVRMSKIIKRYEIDLQEPPAPTEDDMANMVAQRVTVVLEAQLRAHETAYKSYLDQYELMVEMMTMDTNGIRALALLIDDFYQQQLLVSGAVQISAETPTTLVTSAVMQKIAESLNTKLEKCDKLKMERAQQFEALVEEFSMSEDQFYLLSMLLSTHHQDILKTPKKSSKKSGRKSDKRSDKKRDNFKKRSRRNRN